MTNLISLRGSIAEIVREALDYDPATGALTWKVRPLTHFVDSRACAIWNARYSGKPAGVDSKRARSIGLLNRTWRAHRLIWLWVHGVWPDAIDHINGNPHDNRLENLRSVSIAENNKNRRRPSRCESGVMGVVWLKREQHWRSGIKVAGKFVYLGAFKNLDEAVAVRLEAQRKYGFHPNHGRAA